METKIIPVLDKGHVRLVDTMGDDSSIVQAARVSYGNGTKTPSDDRNLIRYLLRHRHTTPFEMCEIKFHLKLPVYTFRQIVRHRTANINELSMRYSEANDEFQITNTDEWRKQSTTNKQGSGDEYDESAGVVFTNLERKTVKSSFAAYMEYIDNGIAREQARKVLPLSAYTELYWKIDLHNLFHFLSLRLDHHAQLETRLYAEAMAVFVKEWVPVAYEAFEDYIFNSITLSRMEKELVIEVLNSYPATRYCIDNYAEEKLKGRELDEFRQKLCLA